MKSISLKSGHARSNHLEAVSETLLSQGDCVLNGYALTPEDDWKREEDRGALM